MKKCYKMNVYEYDENMLKCNKIKWKKCYKMNVIIGCNKRYYNRCES